MQRKKSIVNVSRAVEKLRTHPLVEEVTPQTHIIKGGWANGFVFFPDPVSNRCVIIDPGTDKELEGAYRRVYVNAVQSEISKAGIEQDLHRILNNGIHRRKLLRSIRHAMKDAKPDNEVDVFLKRAKDLSALIRECGLCVQAILATHHHIDHLGVGKHLAKVLGVECYLPNPNIFETDALRGLYPQASPTDNCRRIDLGKGLYGLHVLDISGHTEMVAFLLPDGNLIVGDLLGSEGMWRNSVLYMENVIAHVTSLHLIYMLARSYERILLGHGSRYVLSREEGVGLVDLNMQLVDAARTASRMHHNPIAAAEEYLKPSGQVGPEYLGHALVTARHIEAYSD